MFYSTLETTLIVQGRWANLLITFKLRTLGSHHVKYIVFPVICLMMVICKLMTSF